MLAFDILFSLFIPIVDLQRNQYTYDNKNNLTQGIDQISSDLSWLLAASSGLMEGELAMHEVDDGDEVAGGAVAAGAGLGGLDEGG